MKPKQIFAATLLLALALAALLCACGASRQGETVVYDGFTVRTERAREAPAETEAPTRSAAPGEAEAEADYVLNTSSKKFHLPDCSGAAAIKEKNRWDYRGTRETILKMGYQPCKICNP